MAALDTAVRAGSRLVRISADWSELETSPGVYNLTRVTKELKWATDRNLTVAIKIRTVDANGLKLPSDLATKPLNDPAVISRFQGLLTAMTPVWNSPKTKLASLANEVDVYYNSRSSLIPGFRAFFQAGYSKVKAINPAVSVGVIFAYDSTRVTDAVFKQLSDLGDHVAFTYYAVDAGPVERNPNVAAVDLADMIRDAGTRPLFLAEIGYASSQYVGSSESQQQQFYTNFLQALSRASGKVVAASFFQMSEMPTSQVNSLGASYGYGPTSPFVQFLGTLGLARQNGTQKPAWTAFSSSASQFLSPTYCTNQ